MPNLLESTKAHAFLPLPRTRTADGQERRTGVEIEFGGLDERKAAGVVAGVLGGRVIREGAHACRVEDSAVGSLRLMLDTAFRVPHPSPLKAAILDLSRRVVPVELVTGPLARAQLPRLETLREALRTAGATGSRRGMLLGFGLHLNTEVPEESAEAIVPVLRAFALLEDWLRRLGPIDPSRRLLPFVDPYPRAFVDRLAEARDRDMPGLIDAYLDATPSRNRGLDLLPLFRHIDPVRVVAALGDSARAIKARPTWHFRLPDCRIDEADWRLAFAWNRWRVVEIVAADRVLLDRLASDWLRHRRRIVAGTADWRRHVEAVLAETPDALEAA